ncbi:glycosyltransferase family 39 protein [Candidatus Gottesmanbacteria bacterium]|nr:glycosyltransferase family 39 protein [Candidatus Gottesmanbacteria bacterium]
MKKTDILLILILILSIALRFFYLGKIPNGFYSDEAAYGYNAYSILKTGRDEYGNFLPLAFKSFGDYKAPLYIYFMVPFVWIFGLTEYSVRLSSVVLGIGSIFLIYHLTKKLFQTNSIPLLSAFLIATSPFALQYNRMAHENNLVLFLITLSILLFFISFKKPKYLILSLITFAGSIYAYHDTKIFTPLILVTLFILYRKNIRINKYTTIKAIIIFLLLLAPFFKSINDKNNWSRALYTNIFTDKGIVYEINQEIGENIESGFNAPKIFHNKVISYTQKLIENYLKQFSPEFIFIFDDPTKIYQIGGSGILYLTTLPFLLLGIYIFFRKNLNHKWLIFLWLGISPLPAVFTRLVPSSSRIISFLPVISIIIAIGYLSSLPYIKNNFSRKIYIIILSVIFTLNISYYLHYYYFNTPIRFAHEWHYGMKEVIGDVLKVQNKYSQVWFSKTAWGYIYPLFYMKYPPDIYQTQAKLSALNEFGFGWIDNFGKYTFADIPDKLYRRPEVLYIGDVSDFPDIKKPLNTVYYPDNHVAFYLADQTSF